MFSIIFKTRLIIYNVDNFKDLSKQSFEVLVEDDMTETDVERVAPDAEPFDFAGLDSSRKTDEEFAVAERKVQTRLGLLRVGVNVVDNLAIGDKVSDRVAFRR